MINYKMQVDVKKFSKGIRNAIKAMGKIAIMSPPIKESILKQLQTKDDKHDYNMLLSAGYSSDEVNDILEKIDEINKKNKGKQTDEIIKLLTYCKAIDSNLSEEIRSVNKIGMK